MIEVQNYNFVFDFAPLWIVFPFALLVSAHLKEISFLEDLALGNIM